MVYLLDSDTGSSSSWVSLIPVLLLINKDTQSSWTVSQN